MYFIKIKIILLTSKNISKSTDVAICVECWDKMKLQHYTQYKHFTLYITDNKTDKNVLSTLKLNKDAFSFILFIKHFS